MEAGRTLNITGGAVEVAGMTDIDDNCTQENTVINEARNDKRTDFESKNLERLKEMQDKRKLE